VLDGTHVNLQKYADNPLGDQAAAVVQLEDSDRFGTREELNAYVELVRK
jgi:hypothetical protein